MNLQSPVGRWAVCTCLAALSAGLWVAVSAGWAGDKPDPTKNDDVAPDLRSVITIRIDNPSPGYAEAIGDITIATGLTYETLSPPYSKDLRELTDKLKAYKNAREAGSDMPLIKIRYAGDPKWRAVVRVMDACRKAGLTARVEEADDELDLTNPDIGLDLPSQLNYDVSRIEDVSVPGPIDATAPIGIPYGPESSRRGAPSPLGFGPRGLTPPFGTGGIGDPPNDSPFGGAMIAGGFGGRSGATRVRMLKEGGGNAMSEAAVARGLLWLARHQAPDGHWSLDHFEDFAHDDPTPGSKVYKCSCTGEVDRQDDIAATGFGLLPFLGAGQTHKPNKDAGALDYSKTVKAGLDYLISKQGKDGYFGGSTYSHGIATIALCEAYGMTSDPSLKASAQKAIRFIEIAQDPAGGGWRYTPKTSGDLSVTGWQVMALKSAQMAGLELADKGEVLKKAEAFLDSVETTNKGEYSYMPGSPGREVMTAVGMLCREYMGVNPRNAGLLAGVDRLKAVPPGTANNIYYEYYAAQVMYHMGGDAWDFWNEGPKGKDSHTGIRDTLIAKQCTLKEKGDLPGATAALPASLAHEDGSWEPDGAWGKDGGGRIMVTSLSLLTLEVYYRHVPLYRRNTGEEKDK